MKPHFPLTGCPSAAGNPSIDSACFRLIQCVPFSRMARRRNTSALDDLFDLLEMIFRVVPPWTCVPVAGLGFFLIWFFFPKFKEPMSSLNDTMNFFGLFLGGLFALICLAAGLKGWLLKKQHRSNPSPSSHASSQPECPICRSPMVLRRAKRGQNAGNEFWGCSQYPSCRGIRNLG